MDEKNVKGKKKGFLIGSIVLIILLVIGACAAYYLTPVKPKKVFTTVIDKVYEASQSKQKELDSLIGKVSFKTDIHSDIQSEEKILEILNNVHIYYESGMDFKEKRMHVLLDTKYKEKELLNASFDFQENNAYIYLKDIFSKTLRVPMEDFDKIFSMVSPKDNEVILKYLKNGLNKALQEKYFTKESTNITLNEKNIKVTKNELILNEKNLKEIINVLKEEMNHEEFIESFARLTSMSQEEIKEMIEQLDVDSITLEDTITISIYTKGKEFKGFEIKVEKNSFTFLKQNNNNYVYEIKGNESNFKGNVEIIIKENTINLKIYFDAKEMNGSFTIEFGYSENEELPKIETSNVVEVEKLTEAEQMEIIENLQKKEGVALLMQSILNISGFDFSI